MKIQKAVSMLLACALTIVCFAGCGASGGSPSTGGGTAGTSPSGSASAPTEKGTGEKVTIRFAHNLTTESVEHDAVVYLQNLLQEKSGGNIEMTIFPGAQMGSVTDAMDKVGRGDLEMSAGTTTNFVQSIPEFAVWDLFYMFDDIEHVYRVMDSETGTKMLEPYKRKGVTGLGYMTTGFRHISNSKRPINTTQDVSGLKMRGYNPIQIKAWESVGCSMASISWDELFTALQQNLVDGQECAIAGFWQQKFYEAQKYFSLSGHVYTNWVVYINTAFYEGMSEENRAILDECVKEATAYQRQKMDEAEQDLLKKLADAGCEINEIPLEERQKMGEIMNAAVKDDIIAQCGQDIYDLVMAEVEKQRQ